MAQAKKMAKKAPSSKNSMVSELGGKPLTSAEIREVLDGMRKDLGDGVMLASGKDLDVKVRGVISTQCAALDSALGRGGVPLGRLTILHGPEGCGKTTIALHVVSECQSKGGIAIYLDKEYKLDLDYAEKVGIDRDSMFLQQPSTLEEAFSHMEAGIKHAAALREKLGRRVPVVIVLDSMNAAITKAQFEGNYEQHHIAQQARAFSNGLPKLMPIVYKEDVSLLWVSQVRTKMNVQFGNDQEIAGGNAPKFYASVIASIRRVGSLKKDDEAFGNVTRAEIRKNQVAVPFKKAEFLIRYGVGIDNERSILDLAFKHDVVEKNGAWLSFEGEKIGQGMENASDFLRKHPDLKEKIWAATQEAT